MGLFDKIKDNAKNISIKAIDATREDYEDDDRFEYYQDQQPLAEASGITGAAVIQPTTTDDLTTEDETVEEISSNTPEEKSAKKNETDEKSEKPVTAKKEDEPEKESRRSKVTEISKAEHEKAEKEKRQNKAKQAAKERLAKSYVPSYKKTASDSSKKVVAVQAKTSQATGTVRPRKNIGIIDVAPNKFQSPALGAGYARERAALTVLASQRKLNGTVPLYSSNHMNFKTRVFVDRIEYSGSFGKNVIPIDNVAWVKLRHAGTGVIIETLDNKRVVMVVKPNDRLSFTDAILKVQALQPKKGKFKDTKTVRIDQLEKFGEGVDEIEKLAKLYDKGILTQEEFDAKKKQILGL